MNTELIPVLSGILLGMAVGFSPSHRSIVVGSLLAVLCGFLATVISGEYQLSWAYAALDIAQALGAAFAAFILVRLVRRSRIVF